MRCLILLIIINLIYIASVLEITQGNELSSILNFSVIPLMISVIFFSVYESLLILLASSLLAASLLLLGVGLNTVIPILLYLVSAAAFGYYLRYIAESVLSRKGKALEVIKEQYRFLYDSNQKTQADKLHLEKAVLDISSLSQAPKKMISSTTLEDLLKCLESSINGYFIFENCKLIIFSFKDKEPKMEKVYNISEKADDHKTTNGYEESIVEIMKGKKGPLVVDINSNILPPENLRIPEDIETFIAVPLIAGDRLNGIFCVEDLLLDDMIRFTILAHQFAMILERIRLYELVQELAITDGLTGLFVRRHFLERLNEEVERAKYFNTRLSFIIMDIDHFKMCNDKYGHLVGDVVLKSVAVILKKALRDIDIIGRYGGEEFSVILPETVRNSAAVAGERLRKAVADSVIKAYDEMINITISMGITTFPDDAEELNQLIDRADQMLYKAKEEGRNRVEIYKT